MPARFVFRFETLLRLRKQREDERKRQVAARLRQIAEIRRRRNELLGAIDLQTRTLRATLRDSAVDVDQLRWSRHWLSHLRRGVLEAEAEISTHRGHLAQERADLLAARKDKEVLSRLREKRKDSWLAEESRRERIESDDMNTTRFTASVQRGEPAGERRDREGSGREA